MNVLDYFELHWCKRYLGPYRQKDKISRPAKDFLKEGKPKVQSDGWVEVGVFGSLNFSFEVNLGGRLEESERKDPFSLMKDNWNSLPLEYQRHIKWSFHYERLIKLLQNLNQLFTIYPLVIKLNKGAMWVFTSYCATENFLFPVGRVKCGIYFDCQSL